MDDKKLDLAELQAALGGDLKPMRNHLRPPPKRIQRKYSLGSVAVGDVQKAAITTGGSRPMFVTRLLVPAGYVVDECTLTHERGTDVIGFEEDFANCRLREFVDEDDRRWRQEGFEPAIVDGGYDVSMLFPLLHACETVHVQGKWTREGAAPVFAATIFGESWEEASDVQAYEVIFNSSRSVEVGESLEITVPVDAEARIDRLYVVGGLRTTRDFTLEQILIGESPQLAGTSGVSAALFATPLMMDLRRNMDGITKKTRTATLRVKNCAVMPRHFRGKLIGVQYKEGT